MMGMLHQISVDCQEIVWAVPTGVSAGHCQVEADIVADQHRVTGVERELVKNLRRIPEGHRSGRG